MDESKFVLKGADGAEEVYVDGWTHFFLGYPITKMVFHTISEPATTTAKEVRQARITLCMPSIVAVQMAQTILAVSKTNEAGLSRAAEQSATQLKQLLEAQVSIPISSDVEQDPRLKLDKPKT